MNLARAVAATTLLAILCLPGLARGQESDWLAELQAEVRDRGLDPADVTFPQTLTPEMRAWLAENVQMSASSERTLEDLLGDLLYPEGFGLVYEPDYTATASEVFETRKANCLAFTHLFVAFSRELGIQSYYVNFRDAERYRREGDLVLISGHVTAGFGDRSEMRVLDFGVIPEEGYERTQIISDITAIALHHANRSAELLRDGETQEALRLSEVAVVLDPGLTNAWTNVGVARRRTGDLEGAEVAYRRAIDLNPNHLPAYQNLSALFWIEGQREASREIFKILNQKDNRNPFLYLDLGDISLEAGRLDEAGGFYRRASSLAPRDAETRAARGLWALEVGKTSAAQRWLRRARSIDATEPRVVELERRLNAAGRLESPGTTPNMEER